MGGIHVYGGDSWLLAIATVSMRLARRVISRKQPIILPLVHPNQRRFAQRRYFLPIV